MPINKCEDKYGENKMEGRSALSSRATRNGELSGGSIVEQQIRADGNLTLDIELPSGIREIARIVADRNSHGMITVRKIYSIERDQTGFRIVAVCQRHIVEFQCNAAGVHSAQRIRHDRTDFLRLLIDGAVGGRNHVGNCRRSDIHSDAPS